jgi:hypothetical protein
LAFLHENVGIPQNLTLVLDLVPFAKTDLYDDIACFDAAAPSLSPGVVVLCSTPDSSYGFPDFTAWRLQAEADAAILRSHGQLKLFPARSNLKV